MAKISGSIGPSWIGVGFAPFVVLAYLAVGFLFDAAALPTASAPVVAFAPTTLAKLVDVVASVGMVVADDVSIRETAAPYEVRGTFLLKTSKCSPRATAAGIEVSFVVSDSICN